MPQAVKDTLKEKINDKSTFHEIQNFAGLTFWTVLKTVLT